METYISNNGCVAKYVHDDGSETAIKTIAPGEESCGGSNRNKFNVFISCSVGCRINCAFCFLTSKNYFYRRLNDEQIGVNGAMALAAEMKRRPELHKTPINLSYMGMGEPFLDLDNIYHTSRILIDEITHFYKMFNYPEEIEGIDIATTLPIIQYDSIQNLKKIRLLLHNTKKLTKKPLDRTDVRVFYSLHSIDNRTRKKLIPKTLDLDIAFPFLRRIQQDFNVIYHYMFLEGINDQSEDIIGLKRMFDTNTKLYEKSKQLRILRFNECPNSKFKESTRFNEIIEDLIKEIPNLKVQVSPGSEIQAACGQFLMHYKK